MLRIYPSPGDSPKIIAARYGVPVEVLLKANPQKRVTVVDGQPTWVSLFRNEPINLPQLPGMVGDAASDAINAIIAAGGPCLQANVMLVCAAQAALGVTVDGKWGSGTSSAARLRVSNAPAACSPRPAWWAPVGQSSCPIVPTAATIPTVTPATTALAPAAVLALAAIDPCLQANVAIVCAAQKALGVTVDGKYGTDTSAAARRVLPNAPAACSPRPAWWAPPGVSNCVAQPPPVAPPPAPPPPASTTAAIPTAIQALLTLNPCLQQNVAAVYAAQKALGVTADGKYGTDTATAARRILPNAPAACSPRPTWWAPVGKVNPITASSATQAAATTAAEVAATAAQAAQTAQAAAAAAPSDPAAAATAAQATQTATQAAQAAAQTAQTAQSTPASGQVVVAPEPSKKISTGAIVLGAIGAAALVGVVAVAASGKSTTINRIIRRKSTHRRKSSRKKRR